MRLKYRQGASPSGERRLGNRRLTARVCELSPGRWHSLPLVKTCSAVMGACDARGIHHASGMRKKLVLRIMGQQYDLPNAALFR